MKVVGFPESRHTLCLKCYAWCVSVLLIILTKMKASIDSQEKHRSPETCLDPMAHWMVIKRLEIKIPLEIVTSGRSRTKFQQSVGTGHGCDRKEKHLGQKLQGECLQFREKENEEYEARALPEAM